MLNNYFRIPMADLLFTSKCNLNCNYCFEKNKGYLSDFTFEKIKNIVDNKLISDISIFGGEPTLVIDLIKESSAYVKENRKQTVGTSFSKNYITNGVLLEPYLNFLKDNKFIVQVSLDGCKESNCNRVNNNNVEVFDTIIENIKLLNKNEIPWSIHGVISKNNIKYICESYKFIFNLYLKLNNNDIENAIKKIDGNCLGFIFETEYTDKDVDIVLNEYKKIKEWADSLNLNKDEKIKLYESLFTQIIFRCSAGNNFYCVDSDYDVYICHRFSLQDKSKKKYILNNLIKNQPNKKIMKLFNSFNRSNHNFCTMYSTNFKTELVAKRSNYLHQWCSASNFLLSDNTYFISSKYSVMMNKLSKQCEEYMKELKEK